VTQFSRQPASSSLQPRGPAVGARPSNPPRLCNPMWCTAHRVSDSTVPVIPSCTDACTPLCALVCFEKGQREFSHEGLHKRRFAGIWSSPRVNHAPETQVLCYLAPTSHRAAAAVCLSGEPGGGNLFPEKACWCTRVRFGYSCWRPKSPLSRPRSPKWYPIAHF